MSNCQPKALIQLSEHTFVYRGFTIQKCPRHSKTKRRPYQLTCDGKYLGRDFSEAEVMRTVDKMINGKRPA